MNNLVQRLKDKKNVKATITVINSEEINMKM